MNPDLKERIRKKLTRESVTVLITDSGLGGLAVCAAIAARLKAEPLAPRVSLVYVNAWPDKDYGYNRLADDSARIAVFEQALAGMARFEPDLILIACNTLSVLYPKTAFSRTPPIPVVDIVDFGIQMIREALQAAPGSLALILGTVTTIEAESHVRGLIAQGIAPRRLAVQACDQLASEIEKGPASAETQALAARYLAQAAERIRPRSGDLFAALCCTHFGYIAGFIQARLEALLPRRRITLLDPNATMARFLFDLGSGSLGPPSRVAVRVVSKIPLETRRLEAMGSALGDVSPETVAALKAYEQIPDLFSV